MWNKIPKNEYHKGKPGNKKDPFKKDVIFDPKGQWAYPGEITKIPSGDITMQGVPYPVLGVDNYGNEQMMYPEMDYQFPGNIVTEYPQMLTGGVLQPGGGGRWLDSVNAQFNNQYGGDPSIPELDQAKKGGSKGYSKQTRLKTNRQYTSKNIQSSINDLMIRNETLYGPSGKKRYKPDTKYKMGGWLDQYQNGGVPINSEEEYRKSLLMSNKTKERMDAERAWASKKVATANAAKAKKPAPSAQQLFGIQPTAADATGVAPKKVLTPEEKDMSRETGYNWEREKARQLVRATYGPQGSNPRALYDEEGLINGYLGGQERQRQKEREMKTIGTGLVVGAVAAPLALEAIGSAALEAPAILRAAGSALENPIFGQAGLTPNTLLKTQGMYTGIKGLYNESLPQWQDVYKNPTGQNIAKASLSTLGNIISVSPFLSTQTSKPFTKWLSEPALATVEATAIARLEKFLASKVASNVKSETKTLLKAGIESDESEEPVYSTPRKGLYADNSYYNVLPESTGVYNQNKWYYNMPAESSGVYQPVPKEWLNKYQ